MKGRAKPLSVKIACCKLEFAVEQEQRKHEAMRRAQVEANVRAGSTCVARGEAEAEVEKGRLKREGSSRRQGDLNERQQEMKQKFVCI